MRLLGPRLIAFCFLFLLSPSVWAQPGKDKDPLSWDRNVHSLFQRYCYRCHNPDETKGNTILSQDVDPRLILEHRATWETARSMLESKDMPPEKAKQPSDEERQLMIQFLTQTLDSLDCTAQQDPGPPPFRRLNRTEYDNAVADLTGLNLHLAENFPPDPSGFGFDNIGEVLTLSPLQVEQYHQAARRIVTELIDKQQDHQQSHRQVFFVAPGPDRPDRDVARQVMERFASRAFRRPVEPEFIQKLLGIYDKSRARGDDHEHAVGQMLTAVLISPGFLMRLEQDQPEASQPYPIDDYELASRLSFFLWSRPPDDVLLALAAKGELSTPKVLEAQTLRMLKDPRSQALADNFFGQWLGLREIATHQPDQKQFPEFNEALRRAMLEEVRGLLVEVVQQDRPVTHLIDADYAYLNAPLAKLYGIPGVQGDQLRRVKLTDRRRGGALTSAAVLMLQADPTRTNVPRRGNYVAGRILGTPPPPPPPNVPALEDAVSDGKVHTLRELLEIHRRNPECASCHAKIDPLGFSLENYDAIGRWRETEAGKPIDASGQLPDGRKFSGPVELKQILLEDKQAFVRTLATNLLIYALGRGLLADDECVLREAVKAAQARDDRFSALVLAVVQSTPFRYRRNPEY